ncbi:GNAT family N-acetyltransferase [Ferroplasma acidiphilum]|uniref:GNAT family N-acetyltransferase n=1 Tax=Ferroplasma acidiphilum TaxID=74969 RepID=UPI0023EFF981|nr:GNAT family N-acetyltransferase [Ferroplasma acidiphilum]
MIENIDVSEVKSDTEFKEAIEIYEEAFPEGEKRPVEDIKRNIEENNEKMFIARHNGDPVLFSMIWPVENTDFLFLDYIAVGKNYRGQGVGSIFLQKIFDISENVNYNHMIFEVENPEEGDNKKQRSERIKFYRRAGAKTMTGFKYFLPPRNGSKSQEMKLMMISRKNIGKVNGKRIQSILSQIYTHIYNRSSNDKTLNGILDDIPENITLE